MATPPLGISLAGFHHFIEANGGRARFRGLSTGAVKCEIVLRATSSPPLSSAAPYVELLPPECVSKATRFISHAYGSPFLLTVEAIEHYEAKQTRAGAEAAPPPLFYYFDLLVVNQHQQTRAVAPEVLWREFSGGVRAVGSTLLVLTWDENPLPLTRAWCLAEIVTGMRDAAEGCAAFEVIMPPAEEARFYGDLFADFSSVLGKLSCVDLARARAWHGDECLVGGVCCDTRANPALACTRDLQYIKAAVQKEMAFETANERVIGHLRGWVITCALAALEERGCCGGGGGGGGADKVRVLQMMGAVGCLLMDLGRLGSAEGLLQRAAEGWASLGAGWEGELATARNNEAALLFARGRLDEAISAFHDVLSARKRLLGADDPLTLSSLNNLGVALKDAGRLDEAAGALEAALASRRRVLGAAHRDILTSMLNLASLRRAQGRLAEAEELLRGELAAQEAAGGEFSKEALTSLASLASLLLQMGRAEEAASAARRAYAGRRRTLGAEHSDTLASAEALALSLAAGGGGGGEEEVKERLALLREAFEGQRRALGARHERTLTAQGNLAAGLAEHSRRGGAGAGALLAEAHALAEGAEAGWREAKGAADPSALSALFSLANLAFARGDAPAALAALGRVLDGRRAALGQRHADTLVAANALWRTLFAAGQVAAAEAPLREEVEGLLAGGAPAAPAALAARASLAALLQRLPGRGAEALAELAAVFEGRRAAQGEAHEATLKARVALASALDAAGDAAGAEAHARGALELARRALGGAHPTTLAALNGAYLSCYALGRLAEAEALCAEALAAQRAAHGDAHGDTLAVWGSLATLRDKLGRPEAALSTARDAAAAKAAALGDAHPDVKKAREKVAALEAKCTAAGT